MSTEIRLHKIKTQHLICLQWTDQQDKDINCKTMLCEVSINGMVSANMGCTSTRCACKICCLVVLIVPVSLYNIIPVKWMSISIQNYRTMKCLRLTCKILSLLISLICLIFPLYLMRVSLQVQNFRIYISKFRGRVGLLTYSNFCQMLRRARKFSQKEDDSACAKRVSQYFIKQAVHTT